MVKILIMRKLLLFIFTLFYFGSYSQTWSDNVAQIVYDKCTKCHHTGGIAPFPLMTYSDASPMATAIYDAVSVDEMPPWPPDNNYQQYVHNRALSSTEKTTIMDWVLGGALEGITANTPPPPVYTSQTVLGNGDLTVQIPTYMSKATAFVDDYVCFSVPSGLAQGRTIKSIEIVPGNREIVHHALIYLDASAVEVTDTLGGNCGGPSNSNTKLITAYTPGSTPMTLPTIAPMKLGIDISAGSNVYFGMHYPAGTYGEFDSTKVIFHFYPIGTTGVRQISANPIIENQLFSLPANQVTNIQAQFAPLTTNFSVISVFPHMHMVGKSIKAYGIKPNGDTVKFVNIPEWDFHWQDFYFFKNIVWAPTGTIVKGEGVYDNTTSNPNNPNSPPTTVNSGLNTADEMFKVYFHYMLHQTGDENYDMEALMSASLGEQMVMTESLISIYPNPFSEGTSIIHQGVKSGDIISAYVYDYQGKLIKKLVQMETASTNGFSRIWDGTNEVNSEVGKGVYFVSINVNGHNSTKQLIKY